MSWTITSATSRSFPWMQTTRLRVWVDEAAPFVYIDGVFAGIASYADMVDYPEGSIADAQGDNSSESSESSTATTSSESFTPYYSSESTISESSESTGPWIVRTRSVDLLFRTYDDAMLALSDITLNVASLEDVLANVPEGDNQVLFDNVEDSSSSASSESSSFSS